MQVGFGAESLTVSESSGDVEIAVRVFPDGNGNTPHIGKPFGLRVTSKDGSALGKNVRFITTLHYYLCSWERLSESVVNSLLPSWQ